MTGKAGKSKSAVAGGVCQLCGSSLSVRVLRVPLRSCGRVSREADRYWPSMCAAYDRTWTLLADRVMAALEGQQADAATRAEGRGKHVTSMPTWKETQQHKLENGKRAVPSEMYLLSLIKDWGETDPLLANGNLDSNRHMQQQGKAFGAASQSSIAPECPSSSILTP